MPDQTVNKNGMTALHLAACYGKLSTVQFLIDAGADIHARDSKGRTAQDMAASYEWQEISDLLKIRDTVQ